MTDERLYTIQEVAEALCVSVSTVRKLKREGKISFVAIGTNVRFHKEDIEAFIESQRSTNVH